MAVHSLASPTWPEVRELPAGRTVAVLPTGAIEAHGPHLPLATDVIIADAMARAGAARLSARGLEVLLLPSLMLAPAPFASGFPGTLDVPAEATAEATATIVTGVVRSLAAHGLRVTPIANAHHDPSHVQALRAAVAGIAARAELLATLAPNPRSLVYAIRRGTGTFAAAGGTDAYFGFPAEATEAEGQAIVETLGLILEEAVIEAIGAGGAA